MVITTRNIVFKKKIDKFFKQPKIAVRYIIGAFRDSYVMQEKCRKGWSHFDNVFKQPKIAMRYTIGAFRDAYVMQ